MSYYLKSGLYYFSDLPRATVAAKTDADGRFSCQVPSKGEWVISAYGTRHAGSKEEDYYWLVKVVVDSDRTNVMLANDNLLDSGSADSLVKGGCADPFAYRENTKDTRADVLIARAEQQANAEQQAATAREAQERLARLPQLVKESQARAMKKYPDLAKSGSAFNAKFVAGYQKLKADKSPRLQEPDWPISALQIHKS